MKNGAPKTLLEEKGLLQRGGSGLLDQLLQQYPWFAAGHLVKAYNHQSETSGQSLWQKAMLYGGQTPWIQAVFMQLNNPDTESILWEHTTEVHHSDNQAEILIHPHSAPAPETNTQDEVDAAMDADAIAEAADAAEIQNTIQFKQDPISKDSSALLLEPYHTVDYFASQGIRIREEKMGDDPLSKQVKTFTQWLRTMKKIYVEEQGSLEKKEEEQVQHIADKSNQEAMIVTETMAQVFLQQGKTKKAVEVYQKLSLLHPEKSGYFASLIESLNK